MYDGFYVVAVLRKGRAFIKKNKKQLREREIKEINNLFNAIER